MATITQSNYDNFLTWQKVNGTLTLTSLQRDGLPGYIEEEYSAEALAAFALYDSLGDGLTTAEKSAIAAYIDAEVTAGNHVKKDYETIFSLSGNNALVDYIGGKVATAVNAPIQSIDGYTFDGSTQYINTNYDASIDAINFTQNDAQAGIFTQNLTGDDGVLWGSGLNLMLYDNFSSLRIRPGINNAVPVVNSITVTNGLWYLARDNSASFDIYKDGISVGTPVVASVPIDSGDIYIANRSISSLPWAGTITTFMIGAVLANQTSHNTNLRALLTTLGAI